MPPLDVRASAPGEFSNTRTVSAEIDFADTTVVLDTLAVGDVVINTWCDVLAIFNAATTNVVTLGDGTTGNKYLNAGDVTESAVGVTPVGGKGPFTAETAAGTLTATYSQTGTTATTGRARVYAVIANLPA